MKSHVFICYSHSDLLVAKAVVRQLESRGFVCWAAFRDLEPGLPPLQSIQRALQQSHAALLLESPAAELSSEIPRQLQWLVVNDRPLFTLVADKGNQVGPLEQFLKRACQFELPPKPTSAFWNHLAGSFREHRIPNVQVEAESRIAFQSLRKRASPRAIGSILVALLLLTVGGWFIFSNSKGSNKGDLPPLSNILEQTRELQKVFNRESTVRVTPPPADLSRRLQNSTGMKFVLVPSGSFTRRSSLNPTENYTISLTRPFYLGVTEVTQEQFQEFMGINPSHSKGDLLPVSPVTWLQAVEFCERLNALPAEIRAGRHYRLPTEAEWEFAARAGSGHRYFFGESPTGLEQFAWYNANSNGMPHDVGVKLPNPWGLYDMLGNVAEWCSDWLAEYPAEGLIDPVGPKAGTKRVMRGGFFHDDVFRVDLNTRHYAIPGENRGGFRVVCELIQKDPQAELPNSEK